MAFWVITMTQKTLETSRPTPELLQNWLSPDLYFIASHLVNDTAKPETKTDDRVLQEGDEIFNGDNAEVQELFGSKWQQDEPGCRRILARSEWAAKVLRDFTDTSSLRDTDPTYSPETAKQLIQWVFAIIPQAKDSNGNAHDYISSDTRKFGQKIQEENVYRRILPHSYAAAEVAYKLGVKLNEVLKDYGIALDPWKLFCINIIHDALRFVTHDPVIHDLLLPRVLKYAGLPAELATESVGTRHPRILDEQINYLTLAQLEAFILFIADALTKATDEENPFAGGEPELRKAESGVYWILKSLSNYTQLPEDALPTEIEQIYALVAQALQHNSRRLEHYLADLALIHEIPLWLLNLGISVDETMLEVQAEWGELLKKLIAEQTVPASFAQKWNFPESPQQSLQA